tara:strand:- start:2102 stop:2476 length:375 start_codon:yes stop_codon:yes gene_type:complete
MISMESVTTILELFFTFNTSANSGSIEFEYSDYSDKYFRWTKDSFKHDETLTVIYNEKEIKIFNTAKVKDRIYGNMDKVSSDKDKINFGCPFGIVSELVNVLQITKLSDEDIADRKKMGLMKNK